MALFGHVLVLGFLYLLYGILKVIYHRYQFRNFPGVNYNLILGNALEYSTGTQYLNYVKRMVAQFPRLYCSYFGHLCVITVCHPETIKQFISQSNRKAQEYDFLGPWLGRSVLTENGAVHLRLRRIMSPAFHFKALDSYFHRYVEGANVLIEKWGARSGEAVELFRDLSMLAFEVILKSSFGVDLNVQTDEKDQYILHEMEALGLLFNRRAWNPLLHNSTVYSLTPQSRQFHEHSRIVRDFGMAIIKNRKKQYQDGCETTSKDLLDVLLHAKDPETNECMSDDEILDQVTTFLLAGTDTTATTLAIFLHTIASHPQHQHQCRDEAVSLLKRLGRDPLSFSELRDTSYITKCLKESMRLNPSIIYAIRNCNEDMHIDDYFIPKDTMVEISLLGVHRNPAVWDFPDQFDPSRFDADLEDSESFKFIPFSVGIRNCVGRHFAMHQMTLVLTKLLATFEFRPAPQGGSIEWDVDIVMRSKNGFTAQITSLHAD